VTSLRDEVTPSSSVDNVRFLSGEVDAGAQLPQPRLSVRGVEQPGNPVFASDTWHRELPKLSASIVPYGYREIQPHPKATNALANGDHDPLLRVMLADLYIANNIYLTEAMHTGTLGDRDPGDVTQGSVGGRTLLPAVYAGEAA